MESMERAIKDLMSLQIKALDSMMENLQDEELAIISNDRVMMEKVLGSRVVIVESIAECQMMLGMEMGKIDLDTYRKGEVAEMNERILWMTAQINKRNNRNKMLLKMRLHI